MAFPVEEIYVEKAEAELGVRFPESFRVKMMEINGGGVEVSTDYFELHPFYDTSEKKRIKRTFNSIVHETKTAREDYRWPQNLIIIGNNGGGNILVYKIKKDGSIGSKVYWLDHETDELFFAASDFSNLKVSI